MKRQRTREINSNHNADLVHINDLGQDHPVIINAHQLNQYYHTLLGNPFSRLKYFDSHTQQYNFYRTPGIINYIITYYLRKGSLSTDTTYPPEILYDELVFFGFNIQIIYEILSNLITIKYYIPSGKYRRALWFIFDYDDQMSINRPPNPTRIACALVTICSIIISLTLIETTNMIYSFHHNSQARSLMRRILLTEIVMFVFLIVELTIRYFIRPRWNVFKIETNTSFLLLLNFISLTPVALFLFFWSIPPSWLYALLVVQLSARILRSVRLSTHAYAIIHALSNRTAIYFNLFRSITLIIVIFALFILACEQVSSPVLFLVNSHPATHRIRSLVDIVWVSMNAFTSLGEDDIRPLTYAGIALEFFVCFLGVLTIPQLVQTTYVIVSDTIDRQKLIDDKRRQRNLIMIEDEHENQAIGWMNINATLPEILIQQDEF